jgi:uncharacterized membrane protein SirB2
VNGLAWVPEIRQAHLAFVLLSGTLFTMRGLGVLAGARWPMRPALRASSVAVDTLLFAAGLTLWVLLAANPLRDHWLAAKLGLLVVYVMLGARALRAPSRTLRAVFLAAALTVFATMVSIGWTRDPLGWLRVLS